MKFPKKNLIKVGGKTVEPLGGASLLLSGLSQVPVPHPYPSSDSTAQLPVCMAQIHLLEHHLARTDTIFSASAARLKICFLYTTMGFPGLVAITTSEDVLICLLEGVWAQSVFLDAHAQVFAHTSFLPSG